MTQNNMIQVVRAGVCIVVILCLQACQESRMGDLKEFVANAYKDKKPEIEPLPVIKPYTGYEYSASDEDDPFSFNNILADGGELQSGREPDRKREELENYPLDALKMVGTMTKAQTSWVIVKTSDGLALYATVGNYMGQNNGQITQILTDRQLVVLSEKVIDTAGRWVTREVEITVDE